MKSPVNQVGQTRPYWVSDGGSMLWRSAPVPGRSKRRIARRASIGRSSSRKLVSALLGTWGSSTAVYHSWGVNAHAIEKPPGARGVRVSVGGRARLPDNIRGHERERRGQIRATHQEVVHPGDALPAHNHVGAGGCRREQ